MHHIPASNNYVCVCVAILSALRDLQEKIRRLELEKGKTELSLHTMGKDASHTHLHSNKVAKRLLNDRTETEREISGRSDCNQGGCTNEI